MFGGFYREWLNISFHGENEYILGDVDHGDLEVGLRMGSWKMYSCLRQQAESELRLNWELVPTLCQNDAYCC